MAGKAHSEKKKSSGGVLIRLLLLLALLAVGWQLYAIQGQLKTARAENAQYAQQVAELQQKNDSLRSDIAEGPTEDKMKELARNDLGMIDGDSYLFIDRAN